MYYLNVWLKLKDPGKAEHVATMLAKAGEKSRAEEGCERWEAYQSEADPTCFLLVEQWATKEHWERHREGEAVQQIYLPEVIPHVDREPHPSRLVG